MTATYRSSVESDRLHLLSAEHNLPPSACSTNAPPSVISRSSSASTLKVKGNKALQAQAREIPPAATQASTSAQRFKMTEEEYLAALRAWVEEKQYISLGEQTTLTGFYGTKTMDMYAQGPGLGLRRRRRAQSEAQAKAPVELDCNGRKRSIPMPNLEPVRSEPAPETQIPGARRKSIKQWLGKR